MKKILLALAAVLCCAMMTTMTTACSSDDESVSDFAAYTVNPKGEFPNSNCLEVVVEMRNALAKGLGDENRVCKRDDAKAIKICDEVFSSVTRSGHFVIVLEVTPFGNGLNNTSTIIKSYEN